MALEIVGALWFAALLQRQTAASGAKDCLVAWQVIYRSKAANLSLPCPPLIYVDHTVSGPGVRLSP